MNIEIMSVFDAFEYVMSHYAPYGCKEDLLFKDTYAVISIQDAQSNGFGFEFKESNYCKGVLTLRFDDVEKSSKGITAFDEEMANKIIDFIDKYDGKVDTFLCHCYAGQSRSRAVAAFVCFYIGVDNTELLEYGSPNSKVYRTLMKAYKKRIKHS